MYIRVVHMQIHLDKIEEAATIFRTSIVPFAKQQKGFQRAYLLVDRATGKGVGMTVWETEADLTATETSGHYQEQLNKLREVFAQPPEREVFEVLVQA